MASKASKASTTVNPLQEDINELKRQANELDDLTPGLIELTSVADTKIAATDTLEKQGQLAIEKIDKISSIISPTVVNENYTYINNDKIQMGSRIVYKRGMNTILVRKTTDVEPDFFFIFKSEDDQKTIETQRSLNPQTNYSIELFKNLNDFLFDTQKSITTTIGETINNPYSISKNDFFDIDMLAILGRAINSIKGIIPQLEPITSSTSAPPQPNNINKLEKAVQLFNSFIPKRYINASSHFVKRPQYEDVVLAMWSKINTLNSTSAKTEPQRNLIRTLLQMLLSVIQTWKTKHPGEPMTLQMSRDKTAIGFLIPDGEWSSVTEYIRGLEQYSDLMNIIQNERKCFKGTCSLMGGRKSRKTRKPRKSRRTRRPKRRTKRSRK